MCLGGGTATRCFQSLLLVYLDVDGDDNDDDGDNDGVGGVEVVFQISWRSLLQVELMSAEKFDPKTGKWEMVKEMHRKR